MRKVIETSKAPKAIGPYAQAIKTEDLIFTSGQISIDPQSNEFIDGSIEEQTENVIKNLTAVLGEAGTSLKSVLKTTVYLSDMKDFSRMNEVYGKYFKEFPCARSTVQVAALPKGAKVEIDIIALCKKE